MIYLYLGIAAVLLSLACKGWPYMKDMIKHDYGEYEVHIKKPKEEPEDSQEPTRSAAEILSEMYAEQDQKQK